MTGKDISIRFMSLGPESVFHLALPLVLPPPRGTPRAIPLPLAMPLPRAIPLPLGIPRPTVPPRFVVREDGAGVENFEEFLDEAGGFSTNEVSVVLRVHQHGEK